METRKDWDIARLGWWGFLKKLYRHHKPDGAALIIRLVLGVLMLAAGWWKITHVDLTISYGVMLGFSAGAIVFASWVEFIGGILLIFGLLTKPVCVAFALEMAVIIWGTPSSPGVIYWGHDYNFVLLAVFLALYVGGPGKYSMAHLWNLGKTARKST
ncbi:MAG: DoxX family protein [Patescibacteria group bacterium]|nr:DoxX family protein [Patescibacteria group bacterium]MDE2172688.1 DoxX family protein [Patescibacteria group bacterium]